MAPSKKSPFQMFAIWGGLTLIGIPVVMLLLLPFAAGLSGVSGMFALALALVGWLAFWRVVQVLVRRLGERAVLMRTAIFLTGLPLAFLLSTNTMLLSLVNSVVRYYIPNTAFPSYAAAAIFCWFLALWSLPSGLLTRRARGMYVALHLSNWLFWLGISSLRDWDFFLLILPLGITLLLLGFSESIIRSLARLPFLQKRQSDAVPKSADPHDYEQGYQASPSYYKEGKNIYPYPGEENASAVYSPLADMQQQQ